MGPPSRQRSSTASRQRATAWHSANPRVTFLAETDGNPVGMVNLMIFNGMPKPGAPSSCWVYLGNAFVLEGHRNAGIGALMMEAAIEYAQDIHAARVVVSPSARSVPFYERLGFGPATQLLVRNLL